MASQYFQYIQSNSIPKVKRMGVLQMKEVIQNHHLVYPSKEHKQEEIVVPVRRKVHFYLTKLSRFKELTKSEILAFKYLLFKYEVKNEI